MDLSKLSNIDAIALIVDINAYTKLVADCDAESISQFVRDILSGGIDAIQKEGGEIVGIMGDAILGLLPVDADRFLHSVFAIAKDLNRHCEWISTSQDEDPNLWSFAKGGTSLKITAECGRIDISTIYSRRLGEQILCSGLAINHAARIGAYGEGNRCLLGPKLGGLITKVQQGVHGPYWVRGKTHEDAFELYQFDLGDIWLEGPRLDGEQTYLS